MSFEGFPLIIGWELTLSCNLRCRHCGSSAGRERDGELTLPEALRVCDQLPELLVQEVDFTGGEPLLSPHWRAIAERLARLGIPVRIITNGILLTKEIAAQMRDVAVEAVGVSIDGLEDAHDTARNLRGGHRITPA